MTAFVLIAALLAACAFALLARPAWRRNPPAATPGGDAEGAGAERPSVRLLGALAGLLLVVTAGGYAWLGSPAGLALAPGTAAGAVASSGPPPTREQIAEMVERLAQAMRERPDDANGWGLLARSYVGLGRNAEAIYAFRKAVALRPDDPDLLTDYADLLAAGNNNSLEGEPTQLIARALKIKPDHLKGLTLLGTIAFNRQDYAIAMQAWQQALQVAPADHPFVAALNDGIAQARQRTAAPSMAASTAASRVSGRVTLAPTLAASAAPDDTVFVFARAAEGPRMPLAILRKQVRDLPFDFVLDDSLAMSPTAKLSSAPQLIVGARVSKSGNAMPQSGDLQGSVGPIAPGASGLAVEIGEVVTGTR